MHAAYGSTEVLHGVSLTVPAGGIVALVGPNRSGKTTLLRAISGLLALHGGRITSGSVDLAGDPLPGDAAAAVRRGVGHVLEGRRVFRDLTVEENLRAGAFTVRGNRAQVAARVAWVLDRLPLLSPRRKTPAGHLSGGEQQVLAIARALMSSPRLLLLDEPWVGLAPPAVELVRRVVEGLVADGAGVLVAQPQGHLALGARPLSLDGGRLVAAAEV